MPVPTSSLVFALAAAVPFGLAIKDTVSGKYDQPLVFADHDDGDSTDALEAFGADQALREQALDEFRMRHSAVSEAERIRRLEEEMAAARAVPHDSFDGLIGSEIGSIGERFENLVLGGPKRDLTQLWPDHDVVLLGDGVSSHMLYMRIGNDERVCDALDDELSDAWGRQGKRVWWNAAIEQRAVINTSHGCVLTFEKTMPLDQWIAKSTTTAVPLASIGKPTKQLTDVLGARANVSNDGWIQWTAPGLGVGTGTTSAMAFTKAGRVVGLYASVTTSEETQDAVIARITALVGKEPIEPTLPGKLTWKTSPPISVETGTQMFVTIGEQPGTH